MQVGPDGSRTTGDFYIQKPGKVRFEYDAPADRHRRRWILVVVRDRKLATQDLYPLSQTPLRFLLSDRIDLMRDTNLVSVTSDDLFITVAIEEKKPLIGTSRLMLMIGAKDNQLKQWTVTDPQGYDTTVAVYNLDTSKRLDPGCSGSTPQATRGQLQQSLSAAFPCIDCCRSAPRLAGSVSRAWRRA